MKRTALGVVVVLTFLLGLSPAAAETAVPFTPSSGAIFNNPKGTRAEQRAIITQINRSLDSAPKGATVRMAQYLFDIDSTADKMISAYRRGVNLQVLIDDGEKTPQITRVRSALGTDLRKQSFVATCQHSCMADTASVMHAKFYLFSAAGTARQVSLISSANPYTGNTYKSWNDIQTIVGDAKIYGSLVQYFNDMLQDKTDLNYFRTTTSGKNKVYLYPRAPLVGVNTVTLLEVLKHVSCFGAAPGYGKGGRTVIRVAQWGWTGARLDLARKLWDLHNRGCRVEVIYNSGRTSSSVTRTLLQPSLRYGVLPVYDSWVDKNHDGVAGMYMHLKMMTVNGVWFGHNSTKVTYTGSQNFTGPATRVNNDLVLRILDPVTHDACVRNLNFIRDRYPVRVWVAPPITKVTTDARVTRLANAEAGL